jgi:citrate lyase beta subunit
MDNEGPMPLNTFQNLKSARGAEPFWASWEQSEIENRNSPRRSVLFMPGDSLRKISKATQIEVDAIVMDLEDGVALNRKEEARQTINKALRTVAFGRRERLVRINPLQTGWGYTDLQVTLAGRPDGYVIPKVESTEQVQLVSDYLTESEQARGWPAGLVRLLAIIETAKGVLHAGQIAQASPRLEALMFGAEDLAGDIGATRSRAGWEVFYARSAVIIAAAAFELQAIDMIFTDLNDLAGLEEECLFAKQLGYSGKMAIHPRQVEVINRVFAPSPQEIEQARRLIQAHADQQAGGVGAFEFEGKMVDMPMLKAAHRILARVGERGT